MERHVDGGRSYCDARGTGEEFVKQATVRLQEMVPNLRHSGF